MNSISKLHKTEFVAETVPTPKTLDLRLAVTDRDLRSEVKRAFARVVRLRVRWENVIWLPKVINRAAA